MDYKSNINEIENQSATGNVISLSKAGENVGIGTDSPQSKLHIKTGSGGTYNPNVNHDDVTIEGSSNIGLQLFSPAGSYQYIAFGDPGSVNSGYLRYYHTNNEMVFRTNGSDNMVIDGVGNVGINETSPGSKLQVNTSDERGTMLNSTVTDKLIYSQINAHSSTSGAITGAAALELVGQADASGHGRHAWIGAEGSTGTTFETKLKFKIRGQTASGYNWAGSSEAPTIMTLEGDGNVGIGVTSPENRLHLLTQTTDETQQLLIQNGSSGDAAIKFNISGDTYSLGIDNSDSDKFKLSLGNLGTNDRLVIDSTGNVGIGTTSPTAKLDVNGAANISGAATMSGPAKMAGLSQHANDVAAGNAGLQTGDLYYSVSGGDRIIKMKI